MSAECPISPEDMANLKAFASHNFENDPKYQEFLGKKKDISLDQLKEKVEYFTQHFAPVALEHCRRIVSALGTPHRKAEAPYTANTPTAGGTTDGSHPMPPIYAAFEAYDFQKDPSFQQLLLERIPQSMPPSQDVELRVLEARIERFSAEAAPMDISGYVEWKREEVFKEMLSPSAPTGPPPQCPFAGALPPGARVAWSSGVDPTEGRSLIHYHPAQIDGEGRFFLRGLHILQVFLREDEPLSMVDLTRIDNEILLAIEEGAHAILIRLSPGVSGKGENRQEDPLDPDWWKARRSLLRTLSTASLPILTLTEGPVHVADWILVQGARWHISTDGTSVQPSSIPALGLTTLREIRLSLAAARWCLLPTTTVLRAPDLVVLGMAQGFVPRADVPSLIEALYTTLTFPLASVSLVDTGLERILHTHIHAKSPGMSIYACIREEVDRALGKEEREVVGIKERLRAAATPWALTILEGMGAEEMVELTDLIIIRCHSMFPPDHPPPALAFLSDLAQHMAPLLAEFVEGKRAMARVMDSTLEWMDLPHDPVDDIPPPTHPAPEVQRVEMKGWAAAPAKCPVFHQ